MNPALPPRLAAAADALLEGVSRKNLAGHAAALSGHYRQGHGSAVAVGEDQDALAYLVARLPATYAVAASVLAQLRDAVPDFAPASLLDAGAGPGTASWAALEIWPALAKIAMTDSNPRFLALARLLAAGQETLSRADFIAADLGHAGALARAELVIASFVLAEIAQTAQARLVEKLFAATRDVLVLVEPGTPAGFARIRDARTQLIGQGVQVLGPCTHANACPMIAPDWCHFSQRLPRSRAHMQAKGGRVPYEDERYSWLAVSRTRRSAFAGAARVLAPPEDSKPGIALKLCTPDGLENRFVARRDKNGFAALRKTGWGGVVPAR
ncbi:MAG TPA: small ribosomal subunit Rsm22 family protein [Rhizomicrobium sp.]|jgi:ribosomal protein RSM22 (predicted rRNA methylase)|nr:small ribosomal subunit Rsm22 family protein [Rhizomicrobium sp.]